MPVNCTHPEYDANVTAWLRARHVFAGEDAVKAAGDLYLPRLDSQTPVEYQAYKTWAGMGWYEAQRPRIGAGAMPQNPVLRAERQRSSAANSVGRGGAHGVTCPTMGVMVKDERQAGGAGLGRSLCRQFRPLLRRRAE